MDFFKDCGSDPSFYDTEFLTVEELAKKYKIHRSYIYSKIYNDCFIEGIHYIRIGRKKGYRFLWNAKDAEKITTIMTTHAGRESDPRSPDAQPASSAGTPGTHAGRKRGPRSRRFQPAPPPGTPRINLG